MGAVEAARMCSRTDLDKNKLRAIKGDDIEFASLGANIAANNAKSLGFEKCDRFRLERATGFGRCRAGARLNRSTIFGNGRRHERARAAASSAASMAMRTGPKLLR